MAEHDDGVDDSAEVERLAEIANDAYSGHWHEELIESPDFDPDREVAAAWMKAARAVLADLRERYVLVPREGAEVREDRSLRWGDVVGPWDESSHPEAVKVRRIVVHGPWEVAR